LDELVKEKRVQPTFHQFGQRAATMLAVGLLVAGCGNLGSTASPPGNGGDLTYGAIVGLSGVYGPYGAAYEAGMQVAADRVNAGDGLVIGNKKYTLKMQFADDRSDAQVAVTDAISMINDSKINVIVGPLATEAVSATPVIAQHNAINLSLAAGLFGLLGPNYPLLFSALPTNAYRVGAMVTAVHHFYPNAKKIAFLTGKDDGVMAPMTAGLQAFGVTAGDYTYPRGTTDISTVATKVVAFQPDIIVVGNSPSEETSDLRQLDAAGLPKSVACVCYSTELPSSVGHPQLFPSAFSPVDAGVQSTPEIESFKAALQTKLGSHPVSAFDVSIGLAYYFVVKLTAKAMQQAGTTTDVTKIAAAMTQVSLTEFGAKFQWDSGHNIAVPLAMTQIAADGTTTVIQTAPSS
jgi:ABC-type branched-subunit amino acid transport system substrate-binding protein